MQYRNLHLTIPIIDALNTSSQCFYYELFDRIIVIRQEALFADVLFECNVSDTI
jgi:hypothetical protein